MAAGAAHFMTRVILLIARSRASVSSCRQHARVPLQRNATSHAMRRNIMQHAPCHMQHANTLHADRTVEGHRRHPTGNPPAMVAAPLQLKFFGTHAHSCGSQHREGG